MILKSTNGHNSCVEITKLKVPEGLTHIRFYTTYDKARHPDWEANAKSLYLDDDGVKILIQALSEAA